MTSNDVFDRMRFLRDSMLMADSEWLEDRDDGFNYWLSPLRLSVRVAGDVDSARWTSVIDVVREVEDLEAAEIACNALNSVTAGWAYCVDPAARTITARCSTVGPHVWDQPWHRWVDSTLVAAWHAYSLAASLADVSGGRVWTSAPQLSTALRGQPDGLMEWLTHVRSRPEWAFPFLSLYALIEEGGEALVQSMGDLADRFDVDADGFTVYSLAESGASDPDAVDTTDQLVQYVVQGALRHTPAIGPGFETIIRFPLRLSETSILAAASAANLAMSATDAVPQAGAWIARGNVLDYRVFVPEFTVARMLQLPSGSANPPLVLTNISASLTHAISVCPLGEAHDDSPDLDLEVEPEGLLQAIFKPSQVALRGASSTEVPDERLLWLTEYPGAFAIWGILNPHGPTLVTLDLVPSQEEEHFHLLSCMRHPFSPQYFASPAISTTDELFGALTATIDELLGSPPEFIIAADDENYEAMLRSALCERLGALHEVDLFARTASRLNHYGGRAWDRLNDLDGLAESEQHALWDLDMPAALDAWWDAATNTANVSGHIGAFSSAWDEAIRFLRDSGGG